MPHAVVREPSEVLSLVKSNMERFGMPLPVPQEAIYSWAERLNLRPHGSPMLYTGALYQLTPYIVSLLSFSEMAEKAGLFSIATKLSGVVPKGLVTMAVRPDDKIKRRVDGILVNIVAMLRKAGIEPSYMYEDDLYNGALLYDLGMEELFAQQARKVAEALKRRGAKSVITVDPHTTHMLRSVYPKYVDGFDLEVKSYIEILVERGAELRAEGEGVIHDPCLYARKEGVIEQPRALLSKAGMKLAEARRSKRLTYCCGGPVESLSPSMAKMIAKARMSELREASRRVITMCPICLINLSSASDGAEVVDIAEVLR